MSLKLKTFLLFLLGFFLPIITLMYLSDFFLLDKFKDIEIDKLKEKVNQTKEIVNSELNNNLERTSDWAFWDDTYRFIEDKNIAYIKSNTQNETFISTGWSFIYFVNNEGEIVYEKGYHVSKAKEFIPDDRVVDNLKKNPKWQNLKSDKDYLNGFLEVDGNYVLITAVPILKSDRKGQVKGVLITGFFLDDNFFSRVSRKAQREIFLISYPQADFEIKKFTHYFKDINSITLLKDSSFLENHIFYKDINEKPIFSLKFYFPRSIYKQGVETINYFLRYYIVTFLLAFLVFYFFFYSFVIRQLDFFLGEVRKITEEKNFSLRLKNLPKNEFGVLGLNINQMLEVLEDLKKKSDQKSFRLEQQNKDLEDLKKAMLNILEDEREAKEELKKEKESVEEKVVKRTEELTIINQKLAEITSHLQAAINSLSLGIILVNKEKEIVLANNKIRKILEIDEKEEISCEKITNLFKGKVDLLTTCSISFQNKKEITIDRVDYGRKFLRIKFTPVKTEAPEDKIIGMIFLVEDLTEEISLQRARDEFFSIASHELRTPLTAIRGNTSMILDYFKDKITDENLKEMLKDIHSSSVRLINIVNDFLDISRLEMKKIVFKKENFNIKELTEECFKELENFASEKGLYLRLTSSENYFVFANREKVKQVLINLINNGIKFTEKGGITVRFERKRDFVKVYVEDTGRGISRKNQSLLFRKFQQAEENILTRDVTQGTGLGLYICKLILEQMGGLVGLEKSEIGRGSIFYFTLPFAKEGFKEL